MIRTTIFLTKEQRKALDKLPGYLTENIRKAIEFYLNNLPPASTISPSEKGQNEKEKN